MRHRNGAAPNQGRGHGNAGTISTASRNLTFVPIVFIVVRIWGTIRFLIGAHYPEYAMAWASHWVVPLQVGCGIISIHVFHGAGVPYPRGNPRGWGWPYPRGNGLALYIMTVFYKYMHVYILLGQGGMTYIASISQRRIDHKGWEALYS